ncbi:hypothetical protein [Bradyrhizobium sp.]|uniref:hypothetical protein n=1 Tax=Bradyrhizobium sp. TaxID=376 RepID=UPI001ECCB799|nr:hypothetical protein [Bradyrhizobium sp.]MBV8891183.1 hypothetical protein [Acidobacteriota bacterium]MBV9484227.1 hypothetical protein [Acidobacteriota bacterium]MBV9985910.1 hypothetical protein [Bradyrhizobium sp.]
MFARGFRAIWSVIQPLSTILYLVFAIGLRVQSPQETGLYLVCGLIPLFMFNDTLAIASSVSENAYSAKKTVFRTCRNAKVLPWPASVRVSAFGLSPKFDAL